MRKTALLCALGLWFAAPAAFAFDVSPTQTNAPKPTKAAPAQMSETVLDAVLQDSTLSKGLELMTFSDDGKSVSAIRGELSEALSGDLEQAGKKYIIEHAKLFNVPTNKTENLFKTVRNEEAAGGYHVSYAMILDGVPVIDALIELHMDKDQKVQLANGSFPTVKDITNQIVLSRQDAISAAKRALGVKKVRTIARSELAVQPVNDNGKMVFVVKIAAAEPLGDWEIRIDAETGKEVSRMNQMVFLGGVTGKGTGFAFNPLIKDAEELELPHLTTHSLVGEFAKVVNEDTAAAVNEKDEHFYPLTDTHFDEVNMYYFINKVHDFYKSLGYDKMDKSMKATVHVGDKYDNAYYSPWEDAMAFGDGNRLNDLSREETVCWHEYSHATLNSIVTLTYSAESGAMNEGQADYFACSLSNDPKLGEWAVKKLNRPYMRNLTDDLYYPKDIQGEVHADGRIYGVILWDLRTALGTEIADKLIHKGFFYLKSGSPKFIDGMNAILTADKNVFESANKDKILAVFKKRGVTSGSTAPVVDAQDLKRIRSFRQAHGS